jgi:hypothetical protein
LLPRDGNFLHVVPCRPSIGGLGIDLKDRNRGRQTRHLEGSWESSGEWTRQALPHVAFVSLRNIKHPCFHQISALLVRPTDRALLHSLRPSKITVFIQHQSGNAVSRVFGPHAHRLASHFSTRRVSWLNCTCSTSRIVEATAAARAI